MTELVVCPSFALLCKNPQDSFSSWRLCLQFASVQINTFLVHEISSSCKPHIFPSFFITSWTCTWDFHSLGLQHHIYTQEVSHRNEASELEGALRNPLTGEAGPAPHRGWPGCSPRSSREKGPSVKSHWAGDKSVFRLSPGSVQLCYTLWLWHAFPSGTRWTLFIQRVNTVTQLSVSLSLSLSFKWDFGIFRQFPIGQHQVIVLTGSILISKKCW